MNLVRNALTFGHHAGIALRGCQLRACFYQLLIHPRQRPEGVGNRYRHQRRDRWPHDSAEGQTLRNLHHHGDDRSPYDTCYSRRHIQYRQVQKEHGEYQIDCRWCHE